MEDEDIEYRQKKQVKVEKKLVNELMSEWVDELKKQQRGMSSEYIGKRENEKETVMGEWVKD